MKNIEIYCDGACKGNGKADAIGGWGAHSAEMNMEIYGGEIGTTNNRMELLAAIRTLQWIIKNRSIDMKKPELNNELYKIYTDSNYVKQGITEWIIGWRKKEFVGIKNPDLWIKLDKLNIHMGSTIQWNWVKGHSTDAGNIEADRLANLGCTMLNK